MCREGGGKGKGVFYIEGFILTSKTIVVTILSAPAYRQMAPPSHNNQGSRVYSAHLRGLVSSERARSRERKIDQTRLRDVHDGNGLRCGLNRGGFLPLITPPPAGSPVSLSVFSRPLPTFTYFTRCHLLQRRRRCVMTVRRSQKKRQN